MRPSGRAQDELRAVQLIPHYTRHAEGSVLAVFGDTRVLCNASVEDRIPHFLKGSGEGWVTAEYGMLPRATHSRSVREAARGKQSGRTLEIQRLIGRSLRAPRLWIARAINSLPVPVSPRIKTVESVFATWSTFWSTFLSVLLFPMISLML